jgi:uncharacterized damage-inducible protein DinB
VSDLQYPIGKFAVPTDVPALLRSQWIEEIAQTPARLRGAADGLKDDQLGTPYRPGGWTIRQVVHHVPDSHMNAYVRFKLALTEDTPTIKLYAENLWAELEDGRGAALEVSLSLLETLHRRWALLLRSLREEDWSRTFRHPELGVRRLDQTLALYAWHGRHHTAHITTLRQRKGW